MRGAFFLFAPINKLSIKVDFMVEKFPHYINIATFIKRSKDLVIVQFIAMTRLQIV